MPPLGAFVRRHRRVVILFTLMVLLPAAVFSLLAVRAIRDERVRLAYETGERQRHLVQLLEADLKSWLFATGGESAGAVAALTFESAGDSVEFPQHGFSLSTVAAPQQRPFDERPAEGVPTREVITAHYFPRILAFRRDLAGGLNAGAQYFPRLGALVVQAPWSTAGFVVDVTTVLNHVNGTLAQLTATEPFTATAWIAAQRPSQRPAAGIGLTGFPFFEIVFEPRPGTFARSLGSRAFLYSAGLLVIVTVFGSVFVYRAVTHEAALAGLRSDFVAAVSHEFRSPLASILALAERLDRVEDPSKRREYHALISRDARRLSTLVTRLLDFALIENGRLDYAFERVDLAHVARDAIDASRDVISADRITLVAGEAPLWVRADRTALVHAVQNLIDNAAKYSPREAPVAVECGAGPGGCCIHVQDRGAGISERDRARIFDKFYRAPQGAAMHVEGVGIGLALVRHIVDAHGGTITVTSAPGTGSRFSMCLPAASA